VSPSFPNATEANRDRDERDKIEREREREREREGFEAVREMNFLGTIRAIECQSQTGESPVGPNAELNG